jgi:peptidyl-prolyl cis-trans isomerase SurA
VNQEVITWSELYKSMEFEATPELKAMKIEDRRAVFKQHEMVFLENLVDMRLVLQEAKRAGAGVSDADINRAISSIKEKYKFDDKGFADTIAKEGFTLEEYRQKLADQIISSRVIDQEVRSKIVVTDAEIDRLLAENKDLASQSEGYDMGLIFIKKSETAEARAREVYEKIKGGAEFADIARAYSDDPSGKRGGEIGFIKRSDLSRVFIDKLNSLKPGGTTEPFWTDAGLYLLKLNSMTAFKTTAEFRESLRNRLSSERFDREYKTWMKGLRQRAYIEIK